MYNIILPTVVTHTGIKLYYLEVQFIPPTVVDELVKLDKLDELNELDELDKLDK